MKKSFLVIFLALVVLATVHTSFAASVSPGSGHGPVINRGGVHDYESSAIRYHSGNLRVWSCTNHEGHDAIYMTVFNTDHPTSVNNTDYPWPPSLSSWPALLPSPGYFDEKH